MRDFKDNYLFLQCVILIGVIGFSLVIAGWLGLLERVLAADRSYLSPIILLIYGLASGQWLVRAWQLGAERRELVALTGAAPSVADIETLVGRLYAQSGSLTSRSTSKLIETVGDELMNRHALGHFASDALLRLGLLGTIVGFILMLLPLASIQEFDTAIMQQLLASMSGGMAVALYTTLAGLVTSTLLRFQYHLLDSCVAAVVTGLAHVAERGVAADDGLSTASGTGEGASSAPTGAADSNAA
jgi:biopolymer transport protein ExbB/TolQ